LFPYTTLFRSLTILFHITSLSSIAQIHELSENSIKTHFGGYLCLTSLMLDLEKVPTAITFHMYVNDLINFILVALLHRTLINVLKSGRLLKKQGQFFQQISKIL